MLTIPRSRKWFGSRALDFTNDLQMPILFTGLELKPCERVKNINAMWVVRGGRFKKFETYESRKWEYNVHVNCDLEQAIVFISENKFHGWSIAYDLITSDSIFFFESADEAFLFKMRF